MKKRQGRPKGTTHKEKLFQLAVGVNKKTRRIIEDNTGTSVSEWIRTAILQRIKKEGLE